MYTDISDNELVQFHRKINVNKTFKLTEILDDNPLFIVKQQQSTSVYKIVPLFNCETIISTNPTDKIVDNRMLICTYNEDTIISFQTYRAFQDFSILTHQETKWGKLIHYGVVYEKTQTTPIKDADVKIETIQAEEVTNTTIMTTNDNGEFVHFITDNNLDHIRTTVTYENITHTDEVEVEE